MDPGGFLGNACEPVVREGLQCCCNCISGVIVQPVRHAKNHRELVANLQAELHRLTDRRDDVGREVQGWGADIKQVPHELIGWLNRVLELESEAREVIRASDAIGTPCLSGFCRDCCTRRRLGKKALDMIPQINELRERELPMQPYRWPKKGLVLGVEQPQSVSFLTVKKRLLKVLMRGKATRVGLWGMGGVGKTTLAKNVNNYFCGNVDASNRFFFDRVIYLTMQPPMNSNFRSLRIEIATSLGDEGLKSSLEATPDENRITLLGALAKLGRFLIIMDQVWEPVDTDNLGVPIYSASGGKLLIVTRDKHVCGDMNVQEVIPVRTLCAEEAEALFAQKAEPVGGQISALQKSLIKACEGLPSAIISIAKAGGIETAGACSHYLRMLKTFKLPACLSRNPIQSILNSLHMSTENLNPEERNCFLYCALFPEGDRISEYRLVHLWAIEGLLINQQEMTPNALIGAIGRGFTILGSLKQKSLLLFTEEAGYVRMHNFTRGLALTIMGTELILQSAADNYSPASQNWGNASRASLFNCSLTGVPTIQQPHCPRLQTLFLHRTKLLHGEFPRLFFTGISSLQVLYLSEIEAIQGPLVESISALSSLRGLYVVDWENLRSLLPTGDLPELKILHLQRLPQMVSVPASCSFPSLQKLVCYQCERLRSIPFLGSLPNGTLRAIDGQRAWWDSLEWDDGNLKTGMEALFTSLEDGQF